MNMHLLKKVFVVTLLAASFLFVKCDAADKVIREDYYDKGIRVEYYIFHFEDNVAGEYKFYNHPETPYAYYKPEFGEWHKVRTQEEMDLYWRLRRSDYEF